MLINGSPHEKGCTYTALKELEGALNRQCIETELFWIGNKPIGGCIACKACKKLKKCVFDDSVNYLREKAYHADGFVFGSPVHFGAPSGNLTALMDRLFYSELHGNENAAFYLKPAAAVVSTRRSGATAAVEQLLHYFLIRQMLVISARYWPIVHGTTPEEVLQDEEGMHCMRNIANNMAFYLRCKEMGLKYGIEIPPIEQVKRTNFIH